MSGVGVFFFGFFVSVVITSMVVDSLSDNHWKNRLIDAGLAEYYLDENHQRQWRLFAEEE